MNLYEMGNLNRWTVATERAAAQHITILTGSFCELPNGERVATYRVQGSDGVTGYVAKVAARATGVMVGCTCLAGANETPCKHVAAALVREGVIGDAPTPAPRTVPDRAIGLALLTGGRL